MCSRYAAARRHVQTLDAMLLPAICHAGEHAGVTVSPMAETPPRGAPVVRIPGAPWSSKPRAARRITRWLQPPRRSLAASSRRDRSELGLARGARKWDDVADVLDAGRVLDRALEAEAEAGVRHGAVAAQIAIPPVVGGVQAHLGDPGVEPVEALLALAAADDLADAGREDVHRGDGLAVVVLPHIESLDVLGVVHHDD